MGRTLNALKADAPSEDTSSEVLTETESTDTVAEVAGTRIHMDRAVGGRYVSLGGGERVWVPEEGQEIEDDDPRKIDDADIQ